MVTDKIYNEDCLETMKREDMSVDVILTSPPYNTSRKGSSLKSPCPNIRYDDYNDCKTNEEYLKWSVEIFKGYEKILKPEGCVLYNMSYSSENTELMWMVVVEIIKNTDFTIADSIIWKKTNAAPNSSSSNKLTRICEYVFVFCRKNEFSSFFCNKGVSSKKKTGQIVYKNIFNFIEAPNNDGVCDINKATFSTELCRKLLHIYAPEKAVIYDSFMGTGTTAIAAVKENMSYVGSEISKRYCDYAEKRIINEQNQLKLW